MFVGFGNGTGVFYYFYDVFFMKYTWFALFESYMTNINTPTQYSYHVMFRLGADDQGSQPHY